MPLFIVTPQTSREIQVAIICGKEFGVQVKARSGGHDYEGLSFLAYEGEPYIILDLMKFNSISIEMATETAWVHTRATLGELYYAISRASPVHAFLAGVCPSVGSGGHISGGGFGCLLRMYGLAADHVIDAHIIDSNGLILNKETMGEDLFWAIRGGGGASFGIILAWRIKLVGVPPIVTVFSLLRDVLSEGNRSLIYRWQEVAHTLDKRLFRRLIFQTKGSSLETRRVDVNFNSLFLGRIEDLMQLIQKEFPELGLTAEDCHEMPWVRSTFYMYGYHDYFNIPLEAVLNRTDIYKTNTKAKSDFVSTPIPIEGLEGMWKRMLEQEVALAIFDPFGGEMSQYTPNSLPYPHREGNLYNIQYMVKWKDNANAVQHIEWIRNLYKHMKPFVSKNPRTAYLNYKDLDLGVNDDKGYTSAKEWGEKYFQGNFYRLAEVKTRVDPCNFFKNPQSIPVL